MVCPLNAASLLELRVDKEEVALKVTLKIRSASLEAIDVDCVGPLADQCNNHQLPNLNITLRQCHVDIYCDNVMSQTNSWCNKIRIKT